MKRKEAEKKKNGQSGTGEGSAEFYAACAAAAVVLLAYLCFVCNVKDAGFASVGIAAAAMAVCGGIYAALCRFAGR